MKWLTIVPLLVDAVGNSGKPIHIIQLVTIEDFVLVKIMIYNCTNEPDINHEDRQNENYNNSATRDKYWKMIAAQNKCQ